MVSKSSPTAKLLVYLNNSTYVGKNNLGDEIDRNLIGIWVGKLRLACESQCSFL